MSSESECARLNDEINRLTKDVNDRNVKINHLQAVINDLRQENGRVTAERETLRSLIGQSTQLGDVETIERLKSENEALQRQIAALNHAHSQFLVPLRQVCKTLNERLRQLQDSAVSVANRVRVREDNVRDACAEMASYHRALAQHFGIDFQ
jgi:chromosome segregation ATPase